MYRRTGSALHATRTSVAVAFCLAPWAVAIVFENPIVLAGALAAELLAGIAAGAGRELLRALKYALPLAIVIAVINPLVTSQGLTLVAYGPTLPVIGQTEITLEAIVFGFVSGLRVLVTVLPFALFSTCVDPDELLRALRRLSLRSALTISLATRLVPSLARDARRMSDAYDLRAADNGGQARARRLRRGATLTRALAAGALERGVDVAAALEVRGYGALRRPQRASRAWSRHDYVFALAAIVIVTVSAAAWIAGVGGFVAYPSLRVDHDAAVTALALSLPLIALAPFGAARLARAKRFHSPSGRVEATRA